MRAVTFIVVSFVSASLAWGCSITPGILVYAGDLDDSLKKFSEVLGTHDLRNDYDGDGWVSQNDLPLLLNRFGVPFGDANRDGRFNAFDLAKVTLAGEFQDDVPENSTWSTGDFNGDGEFDSSDLLLAFAKGNFDDGMPDVMGGEYYLVPVPEPSNAVPCLLAFLIGIVVIRSRRRVA